MCSSLAEGFSLVIAEAMTVGLPVISMDCAGPRELLGNGKYGAICQNFDELEKAIDNAISDKEYYQQLAEKVKQPNPVISTASSMRQIEELLTPTC